MSLDGRTKTLLSASYFLFEFLIEAFSSALAYYAVGRFLGLVTLFKGIEEACFYFSFSSFMEG
jgi:hypothetical protein